VLGTFYHVGTFSFLRTGWFVFVFWHTFTHCSVTTSSAHLFTNIIIGKVTFRNFHVTVTLVEILHILYTHCYTPKLFWYCTKIILLLFTNCLLVLYVVLSDEMSLIFCCLTQYALFEFGWPCFSMPFTVRTFWIARQI